MEAKEKFCEIYRMHFKNTEIGWEDILSRLRYNVVIACFELKVCHVLLMSLISIKRFS